MLSTIIVIILGVIHILLSAVLSAFWGTVLIILGIVAVSYRVKGIILLVGIALVVVGVMNVLSTLAYFSGLWLVLGALQIYWGIQEILRYKRVRENPKYAIKKRGKK